MNGEVCYLDIVNRVINEGIHKQPVRVDKDGNTVNVENSTIGLPNVIFTHDMSEGFPLLTTKRMPVKSIFVELEGFIKGITDKNWYKERGCKIWNEWANPEVVKERLRNEKWDCYKMGGPPSPHEKKEDIEKQWGKCVQEEENDLGPIYGYQWRNFDNHYGVYETWPVGEPNAVGEYQYDDNLNGVMSGVDQLQSIADKLKNNPYDRRMVCSAWNPNQIHMMALPPCHFAFNVCVYGDTLNLCWFQRSCDLMLGVPFNIASYAMLLLLLAKHGNFKSGNLTGVLVDCHIYENQITGVVEQLSRDRHELPAVELTHSGDLFDWTHKDYILHNYNHSGKLDFGKVTV